MKPYYSDALVTLYHGDCLDVLPDLVGEVSVDLLLTDPPYGQQFGGFRGKQAQIRGDGSRQGMRLVRKMLFEVTPMLADDAHALLFCHWESWPDFYDACSPYFPIKNSLIWWKDRGGMGDTDMEYARDYEVILYGAMGRRAIAGKRDGAMLDGFPPVPAAKRLHVNEKPVDLLQHLIKKHCPPNGVVLDTFVGSGPTLEAARNLERKAIGIELGELECEITATRLAQSVLSLGAA